jgi:MoxR-like ATPase
MSSSESVADSVTALSHSQPATSGLTLTERLCAIRDRLLEGFVERDVALRLALLAALSGEHLLLIGPPGTAKSLLARRLHLILRESAYFERLLTRFTVPEELFGPLSIKALEEDRYERLTQAYLPRATVAFLDEIFKANSAILNALLTLLNEREFDNGGLRDQTPLVCVVGASNELPEGEELDALYDRFLLRLHVGPVSQATFLELLGLPDDFVPSVPADLRLSRDDLIAIQHAARQVTIPQDVSALLLELRGWCQAQEIPVSDRRWRKVVKLLRTSALTNGREAVSIWDAWLLQHCLWASPEQREAIYDWYAERVGASSAWDPERLTRVVTAWEARLEKDKDDRSQRRDDKGRPLFKDIEGKLVTGSKGPMQKMRDGQPLFLAPKDFYGQDRTNGGKGFTQDELGVLQVQANGYWIYFRNWDNRNNYLAEVTNWLIEEATPPAVLEPTRHKPIYIQGCVTQLRDLAGQIRDYQGGLRAHTNSLETTIRGHLWVTPDFVEPAASSLRQTAEVVQTLAKRVDQLEQGFQQLPQEEDSVPGMVTSAKQPAAPGVPPGKQKKGTKTPGHE